MSKSDISGSSARASEGGSTTRMNVIHRRTFCGYVASGLVVSLLGGCSRVPQVLTDEAVFKELDALYTAVTSKRRDLLQQCQQRIGKLHTEKRLSDAGLAEIEAIIQLTEDNDWTDAAQRLYDFMRAQRKA